MSVAAPHALPRPLEPEGSPLLPRHLVDLFLRPRRFFGEVALGKTPYVVFVTWCYGIASAIERVDEEMLREQIGRPRPGWSQISPYVTESWIGFWTWALVAGVIGGLFLWHVGGWWYAVRLRWSGVDAPDRRMARLAFTYSAFIASAPVILAAALRTAVFPNHLAAFHSEEMWSLGLLVFPFWSLLASFAAATELFPVRRGRALLWFALLPGAFYVIAFGALATFFALLGAPQ
jgi:hypothetical protein